MGLTIEDRVYGPAEICEPVLLDLLETRAVRRLEGVLQHGITGLLGITRRTTRLEHSLGVMQLARRLGAPLEEQVAALLHDVSHTAFSHVIDFVFNGSGEESYHERVRERYLAGSDLPAALARHGYDWRALLDEARFPVLEQPAPALCADRLDYFLRDGQDLGLASSAEIRSALEHLVVHAGRIVVDDREAARWLADTYLACDEASWANLREVGLYELAARAIRRGLELGALSETDLWGGDETAWARLQASPDTGLQDLLRPVSTHTCFRLDEAAPTFRVRTKLRTLDPDVLNGGRLQPLSALDPGYARRREEYLQRNAGEWPVRVIIEEIERR